MKFTQSKLYSRTIEFIEQKPLLSFVSVLALLILLIVLGNILRKPAPVANIPPVSKKVTVYSIGTAPKMSFQAQVEKTGVAQITAFSGGVISKVLVKEGMKVKRGTTLVWMASNYSGGNVLSVSRQLAEKQNQLVNDTYDAQKDLINKQRDIANQTETNAEKLRDITNQSIGDTQNVINLNNDILTTLDTNINALSAEPASNAAMILSSKQLKSQLLSANSQLNNGLRQSQYQVDTTNPPTALSNTQKDITQKQLDIQEKTLDLNKEISALQLKLARINEATMYPSAPFDGVVERVFVSQGNQVNPGTPLVAITAANNRQLKAYVYLSKDMADKVSLLEPTEFVVGTASVSAIPSYISHEAVSGNLYAAIYNLSVNQYDKVQDKSYITANIPMGYPSAGSVMPYVPLDALYQTQDSAYVFVVNDSKAVSRKITLGPVIGSFVRVDSGIAAGDQVIVDRTVTDGEPVTVN